MAIVSQLMDRKGDGKKFSVASPDSVLNALEVMAEANIGAVMVTQDDKIVGIFTERDYTRKGELKGLAAKDTPVSEVMTEQMFTVTAATPIDDCMELMKEYRIRHLPVVEEGAMGGIVSMRDVVEVLIAERDSDIKGLENYLLSTGFST